MALSFPTNPIPNQIYQAPNGVTYVWNGSYWANSGGGSGGAGSGGSGSGGGGASVVLANGTTVTYTATSINFIGSVVTATNSGTNVLLYINNTATTSTLGLVQVGNTLNISGTGVLNANPGNLTYWQESFVNYNTDTNSASILSAISSLPNADAIIIPKGAGAHVGAASGNQRGQYATDWQKINTATSIASGNYAVIGGGSFNKASGLLSTIPGGSKNLADAPYSIVLGGQSGSTNGITGAVIIPGFATGGLYASPGGAQGGVYMFGGQTTDNGYYTLTTDGSLSPTAGNQLTLKDNSAIHVRGMIVAKQYQTYRGKTEGWFFEGILRRDVGSTTTDFVPSSVAPTITSINTISTSGWAVNLNINNSIGSLVIQVKGSTSTQVRWSCRLDTVEVFDAV